MALSGATIHRVALQRAIGERRARVCPELVSGTRSCYTVG